MADLAVTSLGTASDALASGDYFMVVDASDTAMSANGTNKKLAESRVALTGRTPTQTFTGKQAITPDATGTCLAINTPTDNGTSFGISLGSYDNSAGSGTGIQLGRNSNAGTPSSGRIRFVSLSGSSHDIWIDDSGLVRTHTAAPTNATDTAGTVVGDQTSALAMKNLSKEPVSSIKDTMARIATGAASVARFTFETGAYNGQEFEGVIVDNAPDYGQDKNAEFPAGKSLNIIGILGDLLRAVVDLDARVTALEGA